MVGANEEHDRSAIPRDAAMANELITSGKIDLLMPGRLLLADPYWPAWAAHKLARLAPQGILPMQYAAWLKEPDLKAVS